MEDDRKCGEKGREREEESNMKVGGGERKAGRSRKENRGRKKETVRGYPQEKKQMKKCAEDLDKY